MATIPPMKIEFSQEATRIMKNLTKALEGVKLTAPDLSAFVEVMKKAQEEIDRKPNIFEQYFGKKENDFPQDAGDITLIGPECCAYIGGDVISWKGQEYLKPCGELVGVKDNGARNYCVKVVNHPSKIHEDFAGNTRQNS